MIIDYLLWSIFGKYINYSATSDITNLRKMIKLYYQKKKKSKSKENRPRRPRRQTSKKFHVAFNFLPQQEQKRIISIFKPLVRNGALNILFKAEIFKK